MRSIQAPKKTIAMGVAAFSLAISVLAQSDPRQVAFTLEHEGKLAEAESAWGALAKQNPTNPEPLAHMGFLEAKQEHYADAIKLYRQAMALNPTMPGLRLNLGLAFFKAGDYQQTVATLDPLLKAQPDSEQLTLLIGMSQYGLGHYGAASPLLKRASDHDPNNQTLLLTLAHSCLFSSQYSCVIDTYHRLIALNAESAEVDMLVGEALDEMKDHEGAIREFQAAAAADPREPNVHFGLGYLLWTKARYQDAADQFRKEIENNPHHLQAMLYLADTEILMNQFDQAGSLLEKVGSIDSKIPMQHLDLGIVYAETNRNQDAQVQLETAVKLAPNNVKAHYRLAQLYRSMGMKTQAKTEFDKSNSLNKAEDERLLKVMSKLPAQTASPATHPPQN